MAYGFGNDTIDAYVAYLKAYWAMQETGVANRIDDVGSNDAAPTNTPGTRAGISDNACDFVAASSQKLVVPHHADIAPATGIVISLWTYQDINSSHRGVFDKGGVTTGAYTFYVVNGTTPVFRWRQSDSVKKDVSCPTTDYTGAWKHWVLMAESGYVRVYLNNAVSGTPIVYDNTAMANANDLEFGAILGYWDGGIDEVGIWKDLTFADEAARLAFVAALYNGGTGTFYREQAPPTVDSFTAVPGNILEGNQSTLAWTTTGAGTSVVIDQGIGAVAQDGSIVVTPAVTTTYTITATGLGGVDTDTVTVTVYGIPDYPAEADVEKGVTFDSGNKTGTFKAPSENDVEDGVGYGADDTEYEGNLEVPTEGDVRAGTGYGANGTELEGTLVASRYEASVELVVADESIELEASGGGTVELEVQ